MFSESFPGQFSEQLQNIAFGSQWTTGRLSGTFLGLSGKHLIQIDKVLDFLRKVYWEMRWNIPEAFIKAGFFLLQLEEWQASSSVQRRRCWRSFWMEQPEATWPRWSHCCPIRLRSSTRQDTAAGRRWCSLLVTVTSMWWRRCCHTGTEIHWTCSCTEPVSILTFVQNEL